MPIPTTAAKTCRTGGCVRSGIHPAAGRHVSACGPDAGFPNCCSALPVCAALFNRIVGQQVAIVFDFPGVTRDRQVLAGGTARGNQGIGRRQLLLPLVHHALARAPPHRQGQDALLTASCTSKPRALGGHFILLAFDMPPLGSSLLQY